MWIAVVVSIVASFVLVLTDHVSASYWFLASAILIAAGQYLYDGYCEYKHTELALKTFVRKSEPSITQSITNKCDSH